jgi:hypothetical protein
VLDNLILLLVWRRIFGPLRLGGYSMQSNLLVLISPYTSRKTPAVDREIAKHQRQQFAAHLEVRLPLPRAFVQPSSERKDRGLLVGTFEQNRK